MAVAQGKCLTLNNAMASSIVRTLTLTLILLLTCVIHDSYPTMESSSGPRAVGSCTPIHHWHATCLLFFGYPAQDRHIVLFESPIDLICNSRGLLCVSQKIAYHRRQLYFCT